MLVSARRYATTFWLSVQEPKIITVLQFFIYLMSLVGGVLTLIFPPVSLSSIMGEHMSIWWAVSLTTGGLFGAIACPLGVWWAEKVALLLVFTGYLMYFVSVLERQIQSESGSWVTQLSSLAMLLVYLVTRYAAVRFYAYDPNGHVVQRGSALRYLRG